MKDSKNLKEKKIKASKNMVRTKPMTDNAAIHKPSSSNKKNALEIKNLNFYYGSFHALKDINFEIKENEPLFYVEFKTDRPIILKRFNMNNQLDKIARGNVFSSNLFGKGQTLLSRYIKFNNSGLRDKILKEIKNNLID